MKLLAEHRAVFADIVLSCRDATYHSINVSTRKRREAISAISEYLQFLEDERMGMQAERRFAGEWIGGGEP